MNILLIFIGLATTCLLNGCAHDTKSGTASRPGASAPTAGSVTNIYTFPVTGTGWTNYYWLDAAQLATNNTVTNNLTVTNTGTLPFYYQRYFNGTNACGMAMTNQPPVAPTAAFSVTASGTTPLSYQWQLNVTNVIGVTIRGATTSGVRIIGNDSSGMTNRGSWVLRLDDGTNNALK